MISRSNKHFTILICVLNFHVCVIFSLVRIIQYVCVMEAVLCMVLL